MTQEQKHDILSYRLWCIVNQYTPLPGFRLTIVCEDLLLFNMVLIFKYDSGHVPYAEKIPHFWADMDEAFVHKNADILLRYLIKRAMSVEIERIFGYKGGSFNPL